MAVIPFGRLAPVLGFELRLHILPALAEPAFVTEFGPETLTFVVGVNWPLPAGSGEIIAVSGCETLTHIRVQSICPGLNRVGWTVDAIPCGEAVVTVDTIRYLMYQRRWRWLTKQGYVIGVDDLAQW